MYVTCNIVYATLSVEMELRKGTEMDRNAVIFRFFFPKSDFFLNFVNEKSRYNCILVHFCPLLNFNLHRQSQIIHSKHFSIKNSNSEIISTHIMLIGLPTQLVSNKFALRFYCTLPWPLKPVLSLQRKMNHKSYLH